MSNADPGTPSIKVLVPIVKMNTLFILGALLITVGCSEGEEPRSERASMPGSDRDAQGCIGSAGYTWCEHTQQCERPWELAEARGFENTEAEFEAYCAQ
ncbi:MAG: hypothetical protein AAGF57_06755 [Pseudomonadota bacterium]